MNLLKAVIFDMDGLMFDTERLGVEAWSNVGQKLGLNITKELMLKVIGVSWVSNKKIFTQELGEFDFYNAQALFHEYLNDAIVNNDIPVKPGLMDLLDFLDEVKLKKAVATSSNYDDAMFFLTKAGVYNRFDAIVTGDMIANGKPNPDIFLHTAGLLGVSSEECMVLEDSINGIKAAHSAGMKPVMIPDLIPPNEEIRPLLYAKLTSLADVILLIEDMEK